MKDMQTQIDNLERRVSQAEDELSKAIRHTRLVEGTPNPQPRPRYRLRGLEEVERRRKMGTNDKSVARVHAQQPRIIEHPRDTGLFGSVFDDYYEAIDPDASAPRSTMTVWLTRDVVNDDDPAPCGLVEQWDHAPVREGAGYWHPADPGREYGTSIAVERARTKYGTIPEASTEAVRVEVAVEGEGGAAAEEPREHVEFIAGRTFRLDSNGSAIVESGSGTTEYHGPNTALAVLLREHARRSDAKDDRIHDLEQQLVRVSEERDRLQSADSNLGKLKAERNEARDQLAQERRRAEELDGELNGERIELAEVARAVGADLEEDCISAVVWKWWHSVIDIKRDLATERQAREAAERERDELGKAWMKIPLGCMVSDKDLAKCVDELFRWWRDAKHDRDEARERVQELERQNAELRQEVERLGEFSEVQGRQIAGLSSRIVKLCYGESDEHCG